MCRCTVIKATICLDLPIFSYKITYGTPIFSYKFGLKTPIFLYYFLYKPLGTMCNLNCCCYFLYEQLNYVVISLYLFIYYLFILCTNLDSLYGRLSWYLNQPNIISLDQASLILFHFPGLQNDTNEALFSWVHG